MTPDPEILEAAGAIINLCRRYGEKIATAESCTGGLIGGCLTAVDGSSSVVDGGFITYSNEAKMAILGVPGSMLAEFGAVSEPVARAMAEGALRHSPLATLTIAVTGIAGPGGGSDKKPVGLVHFGCAASDRPTRHQYRIFKGDRHAVRRQTILTAFDLIREMLETHGTDHTLPV
ncbi:damage-inducible protein CinA [Thalassospira profundimaris]|uniref:Damage-inducible protein CinA n=1 Tax=Thalassospira profundimaris TaxID=502049 RepID=A0A367XIM3_9PROT|nr:CinA family protein [Thalassospira profundimaris]RCK52562.1 damage-inducible protein CinA [Thalassospira profundimaris]